MHQISEVLKWPTVADLYPHIGMLPDVWGDECAPPASKTAKAESLAAPALVGQGVLRTTSESWLVPLASHSVNSPLPVVASDAQLAQGVFDGLLNGGVCHVTHHEKRDDETEEIDKAEACLNVHAVSFLKTCVAEVCADTAQRRHASAARAGAALLLATPDGNHGDNR